MLLLLLVPLSLLLWSPKSAVAAQTNQVVLQPSADTYIDDRSPDTNYGSSPTLKTLSYSYACHVFLICFDHEATWLKFDLSNIPPSATITSATLTLTVSQKGINSIIGAYAASSSWDEYGITWNNAPRSSVSNSSSDTQNVGSGMSSVAWNVESIVGGSRSRTVSLVLQPTVSQGQSSIGYEGYYSREAGASLAPSLTITYSYVSASVSSPSTVQYDTPVSITANTDPAQAGGAMKLQYSVDQVNWNNIASQTGGMYTYSWNPPSAGTFSIRSQWSISWSGGTYTASSVPSVLIVERAPSSTQLSLSKEDITPGQSVTLTANTLPQAPDGTISLQYSTDGGTNWVLVTAGAPLAGAFTAEWSPSTPGIYSLRATWSGDSNYHTSISAVQTLTVEMITTSLSLTAPTTAKLGDTAYFTATLRNSNTNDPIVGASVNFVLDNSDDIGRATTGASGSATLAFRLTDGVGAHTISAQYEGSTIHKSSSSVQAGLIVSPLKLIITSSVPSVPLVSLNGVAYTADAAGSIVIQVNSTGVYSLKANSPLGLSPGARVAFLSWGDGSTSGSRTVDMESDVTISLMVKTQYYLTTESPYGRPSGQGWYDAGSVATVSVQPLIYQGNDTRRVFTAWTDGSSQISNSTEATLRINSPAMLVASWNEQFYLQVISEYGNATGTGWYGAGSTVGASVQSPVLSATTNDTRYIAVGFTGTGAVPRSGIGRSATFALSSPGMLTFQWKTQYHVQAATPYGNSTGSGWYNGGSRATITVQETMVTISNGTRAVFTGWSGLRTYSNSSKIAFPVDAPHAFVARWKMQYYLLIRSDLGTITGGGWYDAGTKANVTIDNTNVPQNPLVSSTFDRWTGDVNGQSRSIIADMSGPRQMTAVWIENYKNAYVVGGIFAMVLGISILVVTRRERSPINYGR